MTLGLCMIVKNESEVLARVLDVAQKFADEIVVVGSFDFNIDYMEFRSKKSKLSVSAVG